MERKKGNHYMLLPNSILLQKTVDVVANKRVVEGSSPFSVEIKLIVLN